MTSSAAPFATRAGSAGHAESGSAVAPLTVDAASSERFGLTWVGRSEAMRQATLPAACRLVHQPQRDLGTPDTRAHWLVEGDNLEALRALREHFSGGVKLIYIDPPYNTGKHFVYRDRFAERMESYLRRTGRSAQPQGDAPQDGDGAAAELAGRRHSQWLTMMYPRLAIARELLRDDGVLLVSIDDNEDASLRLVLDELFGEENRLATLVWNMNNGATAGHFTRAHETILCYARRKSALENFRWRRGGVIRASALKRITRLNPASEITFPAGIAFDGTDAEFTGTIGGSVKQTAVSGPLRFRDGVLAERVTLSAGWAMRVQIQRWIAGETVVDTKGQRLVRLYFNRNGMLCYEKERTVVNPKTVLTGLGSTSDGTKDLIELGFPIGSFDFPKPLALIRWLVELITAPEGGDVVLDFFAGSATTAHAVLAQNAADGGDRRFVCVQLPEPLPDRPALRGLGLGTLFDLARERVARVRGSAGVAVLEMSEIATLES